MKCSRCNGDDPNCYVCWEEPQEERDSYHDWEDQQLIEETDDEH
jgi:hypothetical protein